MPKIGNATKFNLEVAELLDVGGTLAGKFDALGDLLGVVVPDEKVCATSTSLRKIAKKYIDLGEFWLWIILQSIDTDVNFGRLPKTARLLHSRKNIRFGMITFKCSLAVIF